MTTTIRYEDFERLGRLTKVASPDEVRMTLASVLVEANGRTIEATATDAYRMAHTEFRAERGRGKWSALVSAKQLSQAVASFARIVKDRNVVEPLVVIGGGADGLTFELVDPPKAKASLTVDLVEGRFPDWRALMVKPTDRVPASAMKRATNEALRDYLDFQAGHRDRSHWTKAALLEAVQALYEQTQDERAVAFNHRLFASLVASASPKGGDLAQVQMFGRFKPVWVTVPSDPNWVGLLMPVRV